MTLFSEPAVAVADMLFMINGESRADDRLYVGLGADRW